MPFPPRSRPAGPSLGFPVGRLVVPVPPPPGRPVGNPLQTSASQYKTGKRCRRLWWLDKVAKVRPPQKGYLALGKTLHALAERYQLKQQLYPVGWDKELSVQERTWMRLCADMAIAKGLWQADPKTLIEEPVCALIGPVDDRDMPLLARADVRGEGDDRHILAPTIMHPEHGGIFAGLPLASKDPETDWTIIPYLVGFQDVCKPHLSPPEIHDHKTSKNRSYAKSTRSLGNDEQMLTYAAIMLARCPTATQVVLQHNIFLKKYDKGEDPVYAVRVIVTLAEVQAFWIEFVRDVQEMVALRRCIPSTGRGPERADAFDQIPGLIPVAKSVFEAPPDDCLAKANAKDGCGAYGGCAFREACQGKKTIRQVVAEIDSAGARVPGPVPQHTGQANNSKYTLKPRGTAMQARLFFPNKK